MTNFEKRIVDYITDHLIPIAFIVVTVLGILARIPLQDHISPTAVPAKRL